MYLHRGIFLTLKNINMEKATHFIEYWVSKKKQKWENDICVFNDEYVPILLLNIALEETKDAQCKTVAVLFIHQATTPLADRLAARGLTI